MNQNQFTVFLIFLSLFIILTATFSILFACFVKMKISFIKGGLLDIKIQEDWIRGKGRKKEYRVLNSVTKYLNIGIWIVLVIMALSSVYFSFTANMKVRKIPQLKTVSSSSMSSKNEDNKYLFENDINNQIEEDDLILIRCTPDESDLKLYDIILYEYNGTPVLRRIVKIKEPDKTGLDRRIFITQGDADKMPSPSVKYSQIMGIYTGERVKNIGSFAKFLKGPYGYLCIVLVLFICSIYPLTLIKIRKEKLKRLYSIGYDKHKNDNNPINYKF